MSNIQVQQITKRFRDVTALNEISFTIRDGEFFVLLGPTGAGKTTTLRIIAGLTKQDAGDILFDGTNVNSFAPAERDVAFVFQQYSLYPTKTVYDNLAFPLRSPLRKTPKDQIDQRVREVAEKLHITHLIDRKTAHLSGGEMQRVSIGRALVRNPRIFLMDEPLSNLDAKLREQMRFELKALQESFGITTVYVTHDQEEALALSDRIGLMHEGALIEVGSPADLYLRPAHRVTADFLGSANFVGAQVERNGSRPWDEMMVTTPIGSFVAQRSLEWQPGMAAQLFFRPESVEFLDRAAAANNVPNHGAGLVERVTFLGNSADVILRCNDVSLRARIHPARTPAVGKAICFAVAPNSCIVFPP